MQLNNCRGVAFVAGTLLVADVGNNRLAMVTNTSAYVEVHEMMFIMHSLAHKKSGITVDEVRQLESVKDFLLEWQVGRRRTVSH